MARRPPSLGPKTLELSDSARADIDATLDHIAQQAGLEVALRFAEKIDAELSRLAFIGHSGVSRDWISDGLRMTLIGDYCVFFRLTTTTTRIVRFLHGHRDIDAIMFEPPPEEQDN